MVDITKEHGYSFEDMLIFRQHLSRVRNLTPCTDFSQVGVDAIADYSRSEERRVGKEC